MTKGIFRTPRRHDDPSQGEIELVYSLVKGGGDAGQPPVVFLHGGPGMSPAALFQAEPFGKAMRACTQGLDLVLLDQRGCGESGLAKPAGPVNPHGLLEAQEKAEMRLAEQAAAFFQDTPDADPGAVTPWESALDIRSLAAHLGVPKVSLWAYSYGTHLAQAVLKRCPEVVDRAVFCGFEGPDQTWKFPSEFDRQLSRLGLLAETRALLHQLDEEPRFVEGFGLVSGWGARWMMGSWLGLAGRIGLLKKLLAGEAGAWEKAVSGFVKSLDRPAAFYWCDGASAASPERLKRIAQDAEDSLLGSAVNFPFPQAAAWWKAARLAGDFRAPLSSTKELLVVTGEMDCFTPGSNFAESKAALPNARWVEAKAAFHDTLFLGEEVWPVIREGLGGAA